MSDVNEPSAERSSQGPWWERRLRLGCSTAVILGAGVWSARMLYEKTLLSWREGPQMIGFSWGHTIGMPFILCWAVAHLMLAHALFRILWPGVSETARRMRWPVQALLLIIVVSPTWIPCSILLRWTMEARGPGQHASSFYETAAAAGDLGFMHYLESVGVAVNKSVALSNAAVGGQTAVVEELLRKGADPNHRQGILDRTGLMGAAEMGYAAVVRQLLGGGADPDLKDVRGETALDIAVRNRNAAVVDLLRSASAR